MTLAPIVSFAICVAFVSAVAAFSYRIGSRNGYENGWLDATQLINALLESQEARDEAEEKGGITIGK